MNKSRIEWTDYTLNFYWGCLHGCTYCSARNMARRFGRSLAKKRGYPSEVGDRMANFQPVYLSDQLRVGQISPKFRSRNPNLKPGQAMIFCEEMGDIMGAWVPDDVIWTFRQQEVLSHPNCIFQILTKNPQRLAYFNPWPENCYVGVSATTQAQYDVAITCLKEVEARVKFLSLEPLLEHIEIDG